MIYWIAIGASSLAFVTSLCVLARIRIERQRLARMDLDLRAPQQWSGNSDGYITVAVDGCAVSMNLSTEDGRTMRVSIPPDTSDGIASQLRAAAGDARYNLDREVFQ